MDFMNEFYIIKLGNMYIQTYGVESGAIETNFISWLEFSYNINDACIFKSCEQAREIIKQFEHVLNLPADSFSIIVRVDEDNKKNEK